MRNLPALFYGLWAVLLCANFSTNQSTGGKEAPPINYKGVLISSDGVTNNVENITVSGLYKDIPVYGIPAKPDEKPTLNATYIGLDAIEKIRPISTNPHESIKKFDNRDYIEIVVSLKTGDCAVEQNFLVESTRRIFCDVVTSACITLKKEVAIEAMSSLTITSFQARASRSEKEKCKKVVTEKSAAREALCAQAKEDLKKLEEEIKNTGDANANKLAKSVQDKVDYICG